MRSRGGMIPRVATRSSPVRQLIFARPTINSIFFFINSRRRAVATNVSLTEVCEGGYGINDALARQTRRVMGPAAYTTNFFIWSCWGGVWLVFVWEVVILGFWGRSLLLAMSSREPVCKQRRRKKSQDVAWREAGQIWLSDSLGFLSLVRLPWRWFVGDGLVGRRARWQHLVWRYPVFFYLCLSEQGYTLYRIVAKDIYEMRSR
ncbi:hypothetical protein QBC47DRAFT_185137 [Echria macrotheca]|uniref:Uncharacterized protein n=1 Tax=Echria macrotheca TaxID=438768 RepID=A0AAJ0BIC3_9PEZI|nr:hypothetical protein QBC47DRAFT_185137 [Echria macrotheca]